MLFNDDPSLFLIECLDALARSELDVEVRDFLVENIPFECRFDLVVPDAHRIDVEILGKSARNNYSARELRPDFRRYRKPPLVIKLSFKVVYGEFPFTLR